MTIDELAEVDRNVGQEIANLIEEFVFSLWDDYGDDYPKEWVGKEGKVSFTIKEIEEKING